MQYNFQIVYLASRIDVYNYTYTMFFSRVYHVIKRFISLVKYAFLYITVTSLNTKKAICTKIKKHPQWVPSIALISFVF